MAGLGLYGLISFNIAGRTKEFSIRKVLGAEVKNITKLVSTPYVNLYVISLTVGAPLGYMFAKFLMTATYPYHMPITLTGVAIAVAILISVLILSLTMQIRKILKNNPLQGLNVE